MKTTSSIDGSRERGESKKIAPVYPGHGSTDPGERLKEGEERVVLPLSPIQELSVRLEIPSDHQLDQAPPWIIRSRSILVSVGNDSVKG